MEFNSKTEAQEYIYQNHQKDLWSYVSRNNSGNIVIHRDLEMEENLNEIISIEDLGEIDDYVYDLETECGRFNCGVGDIVVKNTDSVFVKFNTGYSKELNEAWLKGDKPLVNELSAKAIKESIRLGKEASERISLEFKNPIKLEYEKVFCPLVMIGKKRYVGQLYSEDPYKPDKIDYKGVELKRRDNANIVKKVYKQLIDIVISQGPRSIETARKYIREQIDLFNEGKIPLEDLVISKTLKDGYKNANVPHKRLAEKRYKRDLETKPISSLLQTLTIWGLKTETDVPKNELIDRLTEEYAWCLAPKWELEELQGKSDKDLLKLTENFGNIENPERFERDDWIDNLSRKKYPYPGSAPKLNERIPYVYIDNGNIKAKQFEIVEDPQWYKDHQDELKLNVLYYLEHQIRNPVVQFLGPVDPGIEKFMDDIIASYKPIPTRKPRVKKSDVKGESKEVVKKVGSKSQRTLFDVLNKKA